MTVTLWNDTVASFPENLMEEAYEPPILCIRSAQSILSTAFYIVDIVYNTEMKIIKIFL